MILVLAKIPHTVTTTQTSEDTWIKSATGWKIKFQEVKHNITTEDGKQTVSLH